jgi:hypothetical protein
LQICWTLVYVVVDHLADEEGSTYYFFFLVAVSIGLVFTVLYPLPLINRVVVLALIKFVPEKYPIFMVVGPLVKRIPIQY